MGSVSRHKTRRGLPVSAQFCRMTDPNEEKKAPEEEKYDPALTSSGPKSNRGPLALKDKNWLENSNYPSCCVYKNCSIDFRVWGITEKAENYCKNYQLGVFNRVAGMTFCMLDQYMDLPYEDVLKMYLNNPKVLKELRDKRLAGEANTE